MVTTPMPAVGPMSSLTPIGPLARTRMGSNPAVDSAEPSTMPVVPAPSTPVASTLVPDGVRAKAANCSRVPDWFAKAR